MKPTVLKPCFSGWRQNAVRGGLRRRCGTGLDRRSGWFDLVVGAVTAALDHDGLDVMERPIQQGRGQGGVDIKDFLPEPVGASRGN